MMNPGKKGLCDVFGGFGFNRGGKYGCIGDMDTACAPFEEATRPCEGPRQTLR